MVMNIPANLTAGDSAGWSDVPYIDASNHRYDSSGYSLIYELRGPGAPITLNAVADGQGWKTTIGLTDSNKLVAGLWFWSAILTATNVRITIGRGELNVQADIMASIAGFDGRTLAEKSLADAESALADLTASGKKVKKYSIGSRQAEYFTATDLIAAINYWRIKVTNEKAAKGISDGLGNPRNLLVRFR